MEQRRKFLGREVSSTVDEGERGDFKSYLEWLSFFLRPYLVFLSFFRSFRREGKTFFPNDVFKKNDGKRSSRGDLSSDFYSSGGRCCRVIQEICVTRWKFNFKLNFPRSHGSDTLWKGRELKSQLGKSQLFTVYFSVAIIRIEFFLFFKEASTRVGTSKFHRMIRGIFCLENTNRFLFNDFRDHGTGDKNYPRRQLRARGKKVEMKKGISYKSWPTGRNNNPLGSVLHSF